MIKFSCPSCAAVFSVGDEKAGKTGQCPKCQSPFVIPRAEAASSPAPAPATISDADDVEIKPCPGCKATLTVAKSDLGLDVECPHCKTVYRATKAGGSAAAVTLEDRPSRRSRGRWGDDDEDSPRRSRDYDDEGDEAPRRRRRRSGPSSSAESTTLGTIALITGIMAIFPGCCCILIALPLGLTAIITGVLGLRTKAKGMSIAGIVLGAIGMLFVVGMLILQLSGKLDNFNAGNPNRNPFRQGR